MPYKLFDAYYYWYKYRARELKHEGELSQLYWTMPSNAVF